jgi:hypothetical protein
VLWGWGVPPLNAQSLPREVTWNAELQQLCFNPLAEQAELRGAALPVPPATPAAPLALASGEPLVLGPAGGGPWLGSKGNQSEISATFSLPRPGDAGGAGSGAAAAAVLFGVVVMAGADARTSGTFFFVDYDPAAAPATPDGVREYTVGAATNRTALFAAGGNPHFSCHAEGVRCYNDTLRLAAHETTVTLRAFVDNNLAECYWQQNRVASMVGCLPQHTPEAAAALVSVGAEGAPAQGVQAVEAWAVQGAWTSKEELLATPRPDAKLKLAHPH